MNRKHIFWLSMAALIFSSCFNNGDVEEKEVEYSFMGMSVVDTNLVVYIHKEVYSDYNYTDTLAVVNNKGLAETDTVIQTALNYSPYYYSHQPAADGGHVFFGSSGLSDEYYTYNELWKISRSGQRVWSTMLDESISNICREDDGFILVGNEYIYEDTTNIYDGYMIGIDASGTETSTDTADAGKYDRYESVAATPDGGYFTVGVDRNETDYNDNLLGVKFDSDWNIEWNVKLGGDRWDYGHEALVLQNGTYIMICSISLYDSTFTSRGLNRGDQIYVANIAQDSTLLWKKTIGNSLDEVYESAIALSDGSLLILGYRDQNYTYIFDEVVGWATKIDAAGNVLWTEHFDRFVPKQAHECSDGTLWVAGEGNLDTDYNENSVFGVHVLKMSSAGTVMQDVTFTP